jgi:hypothetical protein
LGHAEGVSAREDLVMNHERRRRGNGPLILLILVAAAGIAPGCGGGTKETGTQVEVSQDMLDEAKNADAYFESQGKAPAK